MPSNVRLPGTIAEVAAIAPLFPVAETLAGRGATRQALTEALPGVTHLHLSCHGVYQPDDPLGSRLLLAEDTSLSLRDLLDRPMLGGVRLVVTSACETALTDVVNAPEEALGLPAGLLYAGAAAAVGSLWPVADSIAPVLMARFYTHLRRGDPDTGEGPMRPARALSRAQSWLRHATDADLNCFARAAGLSPVARRDRDWRRFVDRPEHWAPFVVVGDG